MFLTKATRWSSQFLDEARHLLSERCEGRARETLNAVGRAGWISSLTNPEEVLPKRITSSETLRKAVEAMPLDRRILLLGVTVTRLRAAVRLSSDTDILHGEVSGPHQAETLQQCGITAV